MRVFATSDLHTDYKENLLWLKELSDTDHLNDALIVAGDISDRLTIIRDTLSLLRGKFHHVLYTPGNHELWIRNEQINSIEKLERIIDLCHELDVETAPLKLKDLWIVPLFSWYDSVFAEDMSEEAAAAQKSWRDFHLCKWPENALPLPEYFLRMNEPRLKTYDAPVITFSHFLPRRDLLPPKEYLKFGWLLNVSICQALDSQIRMLSSKAHVYGHTHINVDRVIEGVRYVQNAVCYPRERRPSSFPIRMIWPTTEPEAAGSQ